MSATAQEAFEKYYDQLDPYGPNRGTQQIFIDGFNAACAQLEALKKENERLRAKHKLLEYALMNKGAGFSQGSGGDGGEKYGDMPQKIFPSGGYANKEPANEGGGDAS